MTRIQVFYDGIEYSIGNRDIEHVRAEIDEALRSGGPYWLSANHGEGRLEEALLLIVPGVGISLVEYPAEDPGAPAAETPESNA